MWEQRTANLGCVVYSESMDGIVAEWIYNREGKIERGSGKGIRLSQLNRNRRFEGEFEIIYIDELGNKSPEISLTILFTSGHYSLTWKIDNAITDVGIGIETHDKLLVSYKKAT